MVLNTSFNATEPMVVTPGDAVRVFLNSGADVLIVGRCVARKARDHRTGRRRESAYGTRMARAAG
jgi:Carbamoyltransferase C-terminus